MMKATDFRNRHDAALARWRDRTGNRRVFVLLNLHQVVRIRLDGTSIGVVGHNAIARGIVPTIGKTTVQRILAQGDVRPHLVRGWLHSTDPYSREKVTEICDLYLNPPPGQHRALH